MSAPRVGTKSNPAFRNCNRGEENRQCNRATAVFILPSEKCELQVDRADSKGFVLLAIDTTPGYTDTQPFPSAATKWIYQAIYRVGDSRVGQWSNPVSIGVGG